MYLPVHYKSMKHVQLVFKAKWALLGYVDHYFHNGTMMNATISIFVLLFCTKFAFSKPVLKSLALNYILSKGRHPKC